MSNLAFLLWRYDALNKKCIDRLLNCGIEASHEAEKMRDIPWLLEVNEQYVDLLFRQKSLLSSADVVEQRMLELGNIRQSMLNSALLPSGSIRDHISVLINFCRKYLNLKPSFNSELQENGNHVTSVHFPFEHIPISAEHYSRKTSKQNACAAALEALRTNQELWGQYNDPARLVKENEFSYFSQSQLEPTIAIGHTIPKIFHLIWLGGVIPEMTKKLLDQLSTKGGEDGFVVKIWVDQSSKNANSEFLDSLPLLQVELAENHLKDLLSNHSIEESEAILKILSFEYLNPPNYAAISDIYRILILKKYGGIYLDADYIFTPSELSLAELLCLAQIEENGGFLGIDGENNAGIIASPNHPALVKIMKEMVECAEMRHYMSLDEFSSIYQSNWRSGKLEQLKKVFFLTEEGQLIAKKIPGRIDENTESIILPHNYAKGRYCDVIFDPFRNRKTIEVGVYVFSDNAELFCQAEAMEELQKKISKSFRHKAASTWQISYNKVDCASEIWRQAEESVKYFLTEIKPLPLEELLKAIVSLTQDIAQVASKARRHSFVDSIKLSKSYEITKM